MQIFQRNRIRESCLVGRCVRFSSDQSQEIIELIFIPSKFFRNNLGPNFFFRFVTRSTFFSEPREAQKKSEAAIFPFFSASTASNSFPVFDEKIQIYLKIKSPSEATWEAPRSSKILELILRENCVR